MDGHGIYPALTILENILRFLRFKTLLGLKKQFKIQFKIIE